MEKRCAGAVFLAEGTTGSNRQERCGPFRGKGEPPVSDSALVRGLTLSVVERTRLEPSQFPPRFYFLDKCFYYYYYLRREGEPAGFWDLSRVNQTWEREFLFTPFLNSVFFVQKEWNRRFSLSSRASPKNMGGKPSPMLTHFDKMYKNEIF